MLDPQRLLAAYETARECLLAQREPGGHWVGELATSALATATAVSALALVERHDATDGSGNYVDESRASRLSQLIVNGLRWLADHQNDDGGWGDTEKSYSNIATTMLAVAAFHLTGVPADHADLLDRAEKYIDEKGRIDGLRKRYGKDKTFAVPILTNCALAELVPWKEVSPLPFEAACVPQRFYRFLKLPVVSYAIPALVGIGQARYFHKKPWNPIARVFRKLAVSPSLKVLRRMQPESGGYLEAVPLTSFVVMSLAATGRVEHPVVRSGAKFLIDSVRPDGSWPIDTNLATWNTTLSINALAAAGEDVKALDIYTTSHQSKSFESAYSNSPEGTAVDSLGREPQENRPEPNSSPEGATQRHASNLLSPLRGSGAEVGNEPCGSRPRLSADVSSRLKSATQAPQVSQQPGCSEQPGCLDWLLSCQYTKVHPFTGAAPGGWGWSDLSGSVPDADDTPSALLALWHWFQAESRRNDDRERIRAAATNGVRWLLDLQNFDGGWPTFCRGWGKFPFDRSGADLTAHAIRALWVWRGGISVDSFGRRSRRGPFRQKGTTVINSAIKRGFRFIERHQADDGSWIPLWFGNQNHPREENPVYGTAKVLMAYRDLDRIDTSQAQRGLSWLRAAQNLDGSWGAGPESTRLSIGSVEETALAVEALSSNPSSGAAQAAIEKGLEWLVDAVESGKHLETSPIGFYFAKLWYYERLYPQIFTVSALGRALRASHLRPGLNPTEARLNV